MILGSNIAFDCHDARRVAAFWRAGLAYAQSGPTEAEVAAALLEHPEWEGRAVVDEEPRRHPRLFLQTVPEPKVQPNRIRLVVAIDDVDPLLQLGARVLNGDLLVDVEENEFRVVPCGERGGVRLGAVEIDAADPERQARFWSEMLGFDLDGTWCHPSADWLHELPLYPSFHFTYSDDPKVRKNRIHFDFIARQPDLEHQRLLALGARDLASHPGFVTMQDLEGNEFDLER